MLNEENQKAWCFSLDYEFPNAAILIAATAHSIPLFPSFPPDLSIDCCLELSVKTQKITGTL